MRTKIISICKELGYINPIWEYLEHKNDGDKILVTLFNRESYDEVCDSCVVKYVKISLED